jgi:hypothetical protein
MINIYRDDVCFGADIIEIGRLHFCFLPLSRWAGYRAWHFSKRFCTLQFPTMFITWKPNFTQKKTNNEQEEANPRDPQETEATE